MLYPLKLKPVYKPKPWGGRTLKTRFHKKIPDGKIGESWELCCRNDGMSVVAAGKLQGKTLKELIGAYREKLVGTRVYEKYGSDFPLFFKILDAAGRLSVQVHPDDACARRSGLPHGKDEMWYVIGTKGNASLIYGLKGGTSKEQLNRAIDHHRILPLLNEVAVKPGDFFSIPAGTVHAILGGILIAEIQQNCNTTYRLYDWDRTDQNGKKRELHIPQALEAIRFGGETPQAPFPAAAKTKGRAVVRPGPKVKEFRVDEVRLDGSIENRSDPESFQMVMDLDGNGKIQYGPECDGLDAGDTVLIPSCLGKYSVSGGAKLLYTHIEQ